MSRDEMLKSMMVNGQLHDLQYRKKLEKDAQINAVEEENLEKLQTKVLQMEDGMKPEFIQKMSTQQFGVGNDSISLEENMRRKRASQQVGENFMNKL